MTKNTLILLFAAIAIAFSSCKKEADPQLSISFTNYTPSGNNWVVLSNRSGKVLSWKAMSASEPVTLMFPQKDDSVNVTIINRSANGNFCGLTTYTNVEPGNYGQDPGTIPPVDFTVNGTFKLRIPDPTIYVGSVNVNTNCGYTANADNSVYQISVCAMSSLFVSLTAQGTSTMRYLYIPQLTAGDSLVLTQSVFNSLPIMETNKIALGEQSYGTTMLFGTLSTTQNFMVSFWEPGNIEESISMFYPTQVGNLFSSYFALVIYTKLSKPDVLYEFLQHTTSPGASTFKEPQANLAANSSITPSNLSLSLSGSAHFVETLFQAYAKGSTQGGAWTVYSNFSSNEQVVLPEFPDDLKKAVDLSFISNLSVQNVTLTQTSFGGYKSFYKNSIFANTPFDYSSKIYLPNSNGQIGGRKAMMDRMARHQNYSISKRH